MHLLAGLLTISLTLNTLGHSLPACIAAFALGTVAMLATIMATSPRDPYRQ